MTKKKEDIKIIFYILHKYYEIYACFMEVFYDDYVICIMMIYD